VSITVEPVAGSLGAEVHGIDTSCPLTDDEMAALLGALDTHLVVFLPEQHITLDHLERLTDELGGRDVTPFVRPLDDRPFVIRVIKEPDDELNFANAWHSDLSYLAVPPAYTVLWANEVPPFGGDTVWANQYLAYSTLPEALRTQLLSLRATRSAGMAYGTGGYLESIAHKSSMAIDPSVDAYATQTHPVVTRHPRTGQAALFVNPVYTTGIVADGEMNDAEARALLARLYTHSVHQNFTCRLRWKPRMMAIWDNRSTQHLAINDYAGHRREMFRTSVRGTPVQPY
jgi:taurine dioxygenase